MGTPVVPGDVDGFSAILKAAPRFCCPTYQPKTACGGMGASAGGVWNG
jgi:hypothetical protein